MPLVRVDLPDITPSDHRAAIVEVVYDALVNVLGAPVNDKFVVLNAHSANDLVMDPNYLAKRSERALIIQITLNTGRTVELKKKLYRAIADDLSDRTGMRIEDVFINLVEVPKENWSFGSGDAQYAE